MAPHRPPEPPATDGKAVAALLLGLSSLACLGAVTGLPAIILGATARRDIDRSQGALTGSGLAAGGIVTGLFGTGLGVLILLSLAGGVLGSAVHARDDAAFGPEMASSAHAPRSDATLGATTLPIAAEARRDGTLDVVDLEAGRSLHAQLAEIVDDARKAKRTVILQTYTRTNVRCEQIAAALPDARMQHALANVTLVRVDVAKFGPELRKMRVETKTAPWFYKLDAAARPTDAIGADELDPKVPDRLAASLGRFVRRTRKR